MRLGPQRLQKQVLDFLGPGVLILPSSFFGSLLSWMSEKHHALNERDHAKTGKKTDQSLSCTYHNEVWHLREGQQQDQKKCWRGLSLKRRELVRLRESQAPG